MDNTRHSTASKSPLELAKTALAAAREAIPQYTSRFSRRDFTQHQLYALVALRRLLKTDYRGLEATVRDWSELREALGLDRVPDHSTIQRAEHRFQAKAKAKSRRRAKAGPVGEPAESMPLFDRTGPGPVSAPVSGTAA